MFEREIIWSLSDQREPAPQSAQLQERSGGSPPVSGLQFRQKNKLPDLPQTGPGSGQARQDQWGEDIIYSAIESLLSDQAK